MKSFRTLLDRRRDYLKRVVGLMSFARSMGQCIHTNTYNEKTGEWHPHVHMFALLDTWIDQEHLSETWHEITGDSFIVDIRRVKKR